MSEKKPTRDGFGIELVEIGKDNKDVVVVSADLEDATRAEYFRDAYPDRFYTVGIAEQDMVGMACGMSQEGYTVFINSFAVFLTNRAYDMLRMDVCYNDCNVKVICSHGGLTVGEDGASAQCLEDFAIMRVLPNMKVVCPADFIEAKKATRAFAQAHGPMYMRTSRAAFPVVTDEDTPFELGKANTMRPGKDATVIACGVMVSEALRAAEALKTDGIELGVINMHTLKPVDEDAVVQAAEATGAIVSAEEHQVNGGLGGAVAEVLARKCPVPMEMVAVQDVFGQTGKPYQLMERYHLTDQDIVAAVKKVIDRK
jgi:transketolase